MRFATRLSIRVAPAVGAVIAFAVVAVIGVAIGVAWLAWIGLAGAVARALSAAGMIDPFDNQIHVVALKRAVDRAHLA